MIRAVEHHYLDQAAELAQYAHGGHHRLCSSPSSISGCASSSAWSGQPGDQRLKRTSSSWCSGTRSASSNASCTAVFATGRAAGRAILAALSRLLPRVHWRSFLVTPETLLLAPRSSQAEVAEMAPATWSRSASESSACACRRARSAVCFAVTASVLRHDEAPPGPSS